MLDQFMRDIVRLKKSDRGHQETLAATSKFSALAQERALSSDRAPTGTEGDRSHSSTVTNSE
jgi:hypothetical protein